MFFHHVLNVPQPVVDESESIVAQRRVNAAAAVVSADDDVLHVQHIDGVLQYREAVEVSVNHDVGHVAVHEELSRQQADDFVGRHATIRAADPQVIRRLLAHQLAEELRIAGRDLLRPAAIAVKQRA